VRIFLVVSTIMLFIGGHASAAPFLVTDPVDPNADQCVYKVGTSAEQVFPVTTDPALGRICKVDLANAVVGTNSITLKVRNSLWGKDSDPVPFGFTRPATVAVPANTRIVP
jgi:hypothetical protein